MHRPTDSVRIALFDRTNLNSFLVVIEGDDPGNWKLPGGSFEEGQDGNTESPPAAAGRELREEVGAKPEEVGLQAAGTLVNDDGVSARHIFWGLVDPDVLRATEEIAEMRWFSEATLPECKNRGHILGAVATARARMSGESTTP